MEYAKSCGGFYERSLEEDDMSIPREIDDSGLREWCILSGYRGSIAHGMYVAPAEPTGFDDKDVMAICVPPIDYFFGLKEYGSRGTKEIKKDPWDIVVYEIRKFIQLLKMGNPNVLGMLWLQKNHYITVTESGDLLIKNRGLFVGRHVYKSFVGYAYGQLHRMTHWTPETYKTGHMGTKRKMLVEKFGYDTKNASHLIRLLRMGIEFLKDGELNILRHDNQQLLEIKRGEWSISDIKTEADRLFKLSEETYLKSTLPKQPDDEEVDKLCQAIIRRHLG